MLQKSLTIQAAAVEYLDFDIKNRRAISINTLQNLFGKNKSSIAVNLVDPLNRYKTYVLAGAGNCSNKSYGIAYYLLKNNYPFEIVHNLPFINFIYGDGHTVINLRYSDGGHVEHTGIFDPMIRATPMYKGQSLNVKQLSMDVSPIDLVGGDQDYYKIEVAHHYENAYLKGSAIGIVSAEDVQKYYQLLDNIYFPMGNKMFEKLFYDSTAIMLGYFPITKVSYADYAHLFSDYYGILILAKIWLWSGRLFIVLIIVNFLLFLLHKCGFEKLVSFHKARRR
jgi:hypothetical protein